MFRFILSLLICILITIGHVKFGISSFVSWLSIWMFLKFGSFCSNFLSVGDRVDICQEELSLFCLFTRNACSLLAESFILSSVDLFLKALLIWIHLALLMMEAFRVLVKVLLIQFRLSLFIPLPVCFKSLRLVNFRLPLKPCFVLTLSKTWRMGNPWTPYSLNFCSNWNQTIADTWLNAKAVWLVLTSDIHLNLWILLAWIQFSYHPKINLKLP